MRKMGESQGKRKEKWSGIARSRSWNLKVEISRINDKKKKKKKTLEKF